MPPIKQVQANHAVSARARKKRKKKEELSWFHLQLEASYTQIKPSEAALALQSPVMTVPVSENEARDFLGQVRTEQDIAAIEIQDPFFWNKRLAEYQRRKVETMAATRSFAAPEVTAVKHWRSLGPSGVNRGQAWGRPTVSGRVTGIAIAPDGQRVYVATASGGVWRSDDAGDTWRSTMDSVDTDPTNFASASQVCGAIAIAHDDPNRVYVGTGEGDTHALFMQRITAALPAYRGIGLLRSDDGGETWQIESTSTNSPMLAGAAFFALAVDPANRDHVIAATTKGLYQRTPMPDSSFHWVIRQAGIYSSVVVTHYQGTTTFYAAAMYGLVFQSTDGNAWTVVGVNFPNSVGRIALAVQRNNPNVLYALVTMPDGKLKGVWRLDDSAGPWKTVTGAPKALLTNGQGNYDLAIAIDPLDTDLIYLGGDGQRVSQLLKKVWCSSIYRCQVIPSGSTYALQPTYIGAQVHADVHVLVHTPDDTKTLWVGCDGGVFVNRDAPHSAAFASRNKGLATLCCNYLAQHPTQTNIIYSGLQDNGTTQRSATGDWKHVQSGDGGYCVVNWHDPNKVLVFANGAVYRAVDGGQDYTSWIPFEPPWQLMTEPIVSAPYNPIAPHEADIVAFAAGETIFLSNDFGNTWSASVTVPIGKIYALVFASARHLFAGTISGEVYRIDQQMNENNWNVTRIDNPTVQPLLLEALIADVAVDWADSTGNSIYIAIAGIGDYRHVWHFDGVDWQMRSGFDDTSLLDVEHNAIIVDRIAPENVYVGANIGIWHSADHGAHWAPLSNGLPDAPVFDLQIHPTHRLLRVSTHGRGLFECELD